MAQSVAAQACLSTAKHVLFFSDMARKKQIKKSPGKTLQVTVKDLKIKKDVRGGAVFGGCRPTPQAWHCACSSTPFKPK